MAKLAPTSIKYVIKARIKAKGVIEKPDVIGAVFGQTEGLLGSELDLRELQRTGRIGRIEVNLDSKDGSSEGEIIIPSALDSAETSLIAATLETIERVGPCEAKIVLEKVEDTRSDKRKYVIDKAKDILKQLMESGGESDEMSEGIKEAVRTGEITSYKGVPAGPAVPESENIIIVEGRADILNLLKYGIRETIAAGGTGVSDVVVEISKEKNATVFVDGDRGGKLIVRELLQKGADIDFVAIAPEGKEVEELSQKEAYKALREKVSAEQFMSLDKGSEGFRRGRRQTGSGGPRQGSYDRSGRRERRRDDRYDRRSPRQSERAEKPDQKESELYKSTMKDIKGSKSAYIFDNKGEILGKVPISELPSTLKETDNPYAVLLDGKIDSKLSFVAKTRGVRFLVGTEKDSISTSVNLLTEKDL